MRFQLFPLGWIAWAAAAAAAAAQPAYFGVRVVDEQTGRGVPLVELRTTNHISYWTDSGGYAAIFEPGLMGRTVYFHVRSHGYEHRADGFGYRGVRLHLTPGGRAVVRVRRRNIAQRLYRVTGQGIYRDSVLLGEPTPLPHPLLNAQVMGSDSVVNAVFRGRIYWFWGDTNRPSYPLGNFHVPGAVSQPPGQGGLDPDTGVALTYFTRPDGFAKETCRMPGAGPTWIDGLVVLPDADQRRRLLAKYVKIKPPMTAYERGAVEFDVEKQQFRKLVTFPMDAPLLPAGHPFVHRDGDTDYAWFAQPFPTVRAPARVESYVDPTSYEGFTCLAPGSRADRPRVERDDAGRPRYGWKRDVPPWTPQLQRRLIADKLLRPEEGLLQLRDVETGRSVEAHRGSVYWNAWRRRWILIAVQAGGDHSYLGEGWFAEADSPLGPWCYARKIVTHEKYSFYNPKQHPMFDQDGGRVIYFEGTYASTFSGNPARTPRYDYNQVMYKLELDDPRLALPAAVYRARGGERPRLATARLDGDAQGELLFFAPDRPAPGCLPAYEVRDGREARIVLANDDAAPPAGGRLCFYALPPDGPAPPGATLLWEFVSSGGRRWYDVAADEPQTPAARRSPLCRVWANPFGGAWWRNQSSKS